MESKNKIIKIAITGPESSGKSYTTEYLARAFDGWMVPEYAREYMEHLNKDYTYDDVINIAKGQIDVVKNVSEDGIKEDAGIIFFDSELINTKIWCDVVFKKCDELIIQGIKNDSYDHYLLMKPDIEWEEDPMRENPDDRNRLFELYIKNLEEFNKPYTIIDGGLEERLKKAMVIVNTFGII